MDWMLGFNSQQGEGTVLFSFWHHIETGAGAHPASYPMGTGSSLPGDGEVKAA